MKSEKKNRTSRYWRTDTTRSGAFSRHQVNRNPSRKTDQMNVRISQNDHLNDLSYQSKFPSFLVVIGKRGPESLFLGRLRINTAENSLFPSSEEWDFHFCVSRKIFTFFTPAFSIFMESRTHFFCYHAITRGANYFWSLVSFRRNLSGIFGILSRFSRISGIP